MEDPQRLQMTLRTEMLPRGIAVVTVAGECDLYDAPRLQAAVEGAGITASRVCLDLSGLRFLESTALQALLRAKRVLAVGGSELVLVAPSREVLRTIEIAGLSGRFTIGDCPEPGRRLVLRRVPAAESRPGSLFRAVNERIFEISSSWDGDYELNLFCECDDDSCLKPVPMGLEDYERIRARGDYVVLHPVHADEAWNVTESGSGYLIAQPKA